MRLQRPVHAGLYVRGNFKGKKFYFAITRKRFVDSFKNMQSNPDYAKMFRGRPIRFALPLHPELSNDNLVTLPNTRATAKYVEIGKIHVRAEKLCEMGCETPRIYYEKYLGKPYRYFYAISSDVDAPNTGTLIKVDARTKSCKTWQGNGCFPSEPIFVPSPTGEMVSSELTLNIMKKKWFISGGRGHSTVCASLGFR